MLILMFYLKVEERINLILSTVEVCDANAFVLLKSLKKGLI